MEFEPGGEYESLRIERELGRGAFGVVYLARDTLLGRPVALKVLPGGEREVPSEVREQVLNEARLIASLRSPHIVTLYRLHEACDGGFLQEMELVSGGSLEDRLEDGVALPAFEAVRIFRGLCLALRTAHAARIIHGDIKPANVLFGPDDAAMLADFGVARLLEGTGAAVALHGQVFGSPFYMAPEVITGRAAGIASDIWSSAVLMYRLLAGHLPFQAATIAELLPKLLREDPAPIRSDVPEELETLVLRCLEKEADDRPASVEEILGALDRQFPLGASDERPTNLVAPSESIVGRERELAEVSALLGEETVRLVTVTGPGGIGKTRLVQELCGMHLDRFEGGAWFAELGGARDAGEIARSVEEAVGPGELKYRRPMLLVLDGFQHLASHAPDTVGRWCREAPQVRFLVASRALLHLAGERLYELGPLGPADATRLFSDRGGEESADFGDLEGVPLGLVEGREALSEAVRRSFDLLVDWERGAFLGACELPDGFTLDDAENRLDLSEFPDAPLAMDAVQSLRDKSLLRRWEEDGESRFGMYRFVREFGLRARG